MEHITLNNTFNTRDLGGYENKNNKTVKKGLLYRSDKLFGLDNSDIDKLHSLGIKTIIDFRSVSEKKKYPNPTIENIKYLELEIDCSKNMDYEIQSILNNTKNPKTFLTELNKDFILKYSSVFSTFLKYIIKHKEPTLFHCSAGKDRTGLATMFIYYILDLHYEVIMMDYLNSNIYLKRDIKILLEKFVDNLDVSAENVIKLKPLLGVDIVYIKAALDTISKYPNVSNVKDYITKYLDISEELQNEFKEYLLK